MKTRTPALIAAAAALIGTASATAAIPTPLQIAPGGNIRAVTTATDRHGWPHETTQAEARAVGDLALWHAKQDIRPGELLTGVCYFGQTIARSYCGAVFVGPRGRRAYRINAKVWEDGAYRLALALPRARRPVVSRDKLPDEPFCNGTSAGYCDPVDPAVVGHVPPDAPKP